ncbi:lipopolysaccharide assembly protein LapA domain-containing protein [Pseudomonas sp. NPDC089569]|uniref:lipopolysaccharide assembly protein LapA domain-containing protein n=1 Tax=Pseudomonas sp. NPDC089569 TaxID=3390722 RepID=UPI003D00B515
MRNFKRVVFAVFGLLLVLAVVTFVLENQQSVSLLFFGWAGPQLPVSVILVSALLIGMLIGPVAGWFLSRSSRAAGKRLT